MHFEDGVCMSLFKRCNPFWERRPQMTHIFREALNHQQVFCVLKASQAIPGAFETQAVLLTQWF